MKINKKAKRIIKSQWRIFEHNLSKKIGGIYFDNVRFKQATGRKLELKQPVYLNDKLFWLNRYWQHPLKTICADKYLMREYLNNKEMSELSIPVLGVWRNPEEIQYESLPAQFMLKCNHGCGFNIICRDKKIFNFEEARLKLKTWLRIDYGKLFGELHYSSIKPLIIAEKYINTSNSDSMVDYKIHCINGKPAFFLVCRERETGDVKFSSYSLDWKRLDYLKEEDLTPLSKPTCLVELLNYAYLLSADFPYVRLDFYIIDDKLYLGEFTFTPYGNTIEIYKESILLIFGEKLQLPSSYQN